MDMATTLPPITMGLELAIPDIERIDSADRSFVLRSRMPLRPYARCIGEWLEYWACTTPERVFLAERTAGNHWRRLSYAQVRSEVGAIAQGLLDMGLAAEAPVVILSDNNVDSALLMLAAMHVGVPVSFVSPAYTRMAKDHAKLHSLLELLSPGLLYADDGAVYGMAMANAGLGCPMLFSHNVQEGAGDLGGLRKSRETPAVMEAFRRITPDIHAKYLLTSGSTGTPKAVINTHRMLCSNQEAMAQVWPFIDHAAPVLVDWLPWSHTFGANHNFNLVLRNGGTLYIDEGRPVPGLMEKTVRNLSELSPTLYFNVPRGFDALLPYLEQNESFAHHFFNGLQMMFFAAAALPKPVWDRFTALAQRHRTTPLFFSSAWGATETSPTVTSLHFHFDRPGNLGVPLPGTELKFVPNGSKLEMRVRGDQVTPGYHNAPELTKQAFDEQGFYLIGDAGLLADPADPNGGVMFDGRVSEDFKLTTGTWVSVGTLRLRAVAALMPYAQDVVVAGHDRDEIGLMIFPSPALRKFAGDDANALSGEELTAHDDVRKAISAALAALNAGQGSSGRAARAVILSSAPDLGLGETTDKGYTNQRRVLTLRAREVERLFGTGASVIYPATN
jgi:feruloyl-CoA synthase